MWHLLHFWWTTNQHKLTITCENHDSLNKLDKLLSRMHDGNSGKSLTPIITAPSHALKSSGVFTGSCSPACEKESWSNENCSKFWLQRLPVIIKDNCQCANLRKSTELLTVSNFTPFNYSGQPVCNIFYFKKQLCGKSGKKMCNV